jgi:hypothetical protein
MPSSHPVQHAPSPWTTKSECYWLFLYLKDLPAGLYDPLEGQRFGDGNLSEEKEKVGEFKGGLGLIMIVRYADTPVGKFIFFPSPWIISSYLLFGPRILFASSALAKARSAPFSRVNSVCCSIVKARVSSFAINDLCRFDKWDSGAVPKFCIHLNVRLNV